MKSWSQMQQWLQQQASHTPLEHPGRTLVEIAGKERLVIEHHRGIQCYGTEEILVRTSIGQLHISGAEMRLCCMSREQLCIAGRIDRVELMGRTDRGSLE